MGQSERPPRPVLAANIERLAARAAEGEPAARLELAHATAAALVNAGRTDPTVHTEQLVELADMVGLDTLAQLWRGADDDTLPGVLWALYLLRSWCQVCSEDVARLLRAGRAFAPVDEIVAGLPDDADESAVRRLADAILTGAYQGDFAVALERAAAVFRIVAVGRRELAEPGMGDLASLDRTDDPAGQPGDGRSAGPRQAGEPRRIGDQSGDQIGDRSGEQEHKRVQQPGQSDSGHAHGKLAKRNERCAEALSRAAAAWRGGTLT